jgi:Zn-dependent protease with chaperone function
LPWDDDHDIFLYGVDPDEVHRKLADIISDHGYVMVRDPRGFFWIREKRWPAASGHLALEFLPPLVTNPQDLPVWEGGAPHLLASELARTQDLPFYGSYIRAPAEVEAVLARLYGAAGSPEVMKAFTRPALHADMADFWARARQPGQLDWPAISALAMAAAPRRSVVVVQRGLYHRHRQDQVLGAAQAGGLARQPKPGN